jgi:hypothetical protein
VLQGAGDFEPAPPAAREALHVVIAPLPEANEAQQRLDALAALGPRHAVENTVQFHVLGRG